MRRRRVRFSDYYDNIIKEEIAKIYNVDKDKIFLGSRKKNIIFAKRMYIFVLRNVFHMTLVEIAEITNMHHASIIHHSRKFEFFYNNYPKDTEAFKQIESRIIEVEVEEEIIALEKRKASIEDSLTKLYLIKSQKHEREKRKNLLTK
jgi:transcription initiation factor TFIIIB Brf1 subunit/transcription initiation factor TFIIB|tara:strand:- start:85 stop:525 length:441 start_codon:yes stop_codon:yes gene_type:complete